MALRKKGAPTKASSSPRKRAAGCEAGGDEDVQSAPAKKGKMATEAEREIVTPEDEIVTSDDIHEVHRETACVAEEGSVEGVGSSLGVSDAIDECYHKLRCELTTLRNSSVPSLFPEVLRKLDDIERIFLHVGNTAEFNEASRESRMTFIKLLMFRLGMLEMAGTKLVQQAFDQESPDASDLPDLDVGADDLGDYPDDTMDVDAQEGAGDVPSTPSGGSASDTVTSLTLSSSGSGMRSSLTKGANGVPSSPLAGKGVPDNQQQIPYFLAAPRPLASASVYCQKGDGYTVAYNGTDLAEHFGGKALARLTEYENIRPRGIPVLRNMAMADPNELYYKAGGYLSFAKEPLRGKAVRFLAVGVVKNATPTSGTINRSVNIAISSRISDRMFAVAAAASKFKSFNVNTYREGVTFSTRFSPRSGNAEGAVAPSLTPSTLENGDVHWPTDSLAWNNDIPVFNGTSPFRFNDFPSLARVDDTLEEGDAAMVIFTVGFYDKENLDKACHTKKFISLNAQAVILLTKCFDHDMGTAAVAKNREPFPVLQGKVDSRAANTSPKKQAEAVCDLI